MKQAGQEERAAEAADLARRGDAHAAEGNADAAVAAWRDALDRSPDLPTAHLGIGRTLLAGDDPARLGEATARLRDAARLRPGHGETLNLLGCALRKAGQVEAAAAAFADAVRADPAASEPHTNLGTACYELGRLPEAIAEHERAVRLRPGDPKAHFNLALALLAAGRWDRGWAEYEWRRRALNDPSDKLDVPQPPWTGWDPAGATLMVLCEQGLGDTLQFIRYVPLLAESGARVVVEAQPPLRHLLAGVRGVGRVVVRGEPMPPFDAHVKLLSLPAILGTRLGSVPSEVPYLRPDPAREATWARRLAALGHGFKVGINWAGSGLMHVGAVRSLPLAALEPLARVPGVRLFSLQKHVGTEELAGVAGRFPVETFGDPPLDEGEGAAFMDTAAVVRHLDLVVTCDTSIAHLAGAVGARTWVALPAFSDWRFLRGRDDSPWYPTMRLFRQRRPDDWAEVVGRMAVALAELVGDQPAATAGSPSPAVETPPPPPPPPPPLLAPMSPGEVLDRLAILQIKVRRIADPGKLAHVRAERDALGAAREASVPHTPELGRLAVELRRVNEELWHVEDAIRAAEAAGDFGPAFVTLARRVYRTNDRRADLKRQVNALLGSAIADEKEYRAAAAAAAAAPRRP